MNLNIDIAKRFHEAAVIDDQGKVIVKRIKNAARLIFVVPFGLLLLSLPSKTLPFIIFIFHSWSKK